MYINIDCILIFLCLISFSNLAIKKFNFFLLLVKYRVVTGIVYDRADSNEMFAKHFIYFRICTGSLCDNKLV